MALKIINTVFLDRDGVINQDSPDFIKTPEEFVFIPGSLEALRLLKQHNLMAVVISNQSGIGREIVTLENLYSINTGMQEAVRSSGGDIREIFFCPHHPNDGCDCRKPKPGLFFEAQAVLDTDLERACMIGDSSRDLAAAKAAGCGLLILVRTGNGEKALKELKDFGFQPDHVADDLLAAVKWLLAC